MTLELIEKTRENAGSSPTLADYEEGRRTFSWGAAARELDGLPGGGGFNIPYEAVDRHATYAELRALTNRFANGLAALHVTPGEHAFALLGRVSALYVAASGALKHGDVFCSLFSAFGPEPIRARVPLGAARVLVTTGALYRKKIAGLTADATRETLRRILRSIAALGARDDLRATLDLDSMDFLKFITGLHTELGVDVPEADHRKVASLEACEGYLAAHRP